MTLTSELRSSIAARFLPNRAAELGDDADLFLLLDSLDVIRLVTQLEKTYRVEIGDDELTAENIGSISRIASFLERKRAGR